MPKTGYCVKCKKKQEMHNEEQFVMKNGKPALRGECPTCRTRMTLIMGGQKAQKAQEKV